MTHPNPKLPASSSLKLSRRELATPDPSRRLGPVPPFAPLDGLVHRGAEAASARSREQTTTGPKEEGRLQAGFRSLRVLQGLATSLARAYNRD